MDKIQPVPVMIIAKTLHWPLIDSDPLYVTSAVGEGVIDLRPPHISDGSLSYRVELKIFNAPLTMGRLL